MVTFYKHEKQCELESQVKSEILGDLNAGLFHDNPELKNYLFCLFKKMNWQRYDGSFHINQLKKDIARNDILTKAINDCCYQQGSTGMERAYNFYKCYRETIPKDYDTPI